MNTGRRIPVLLMVRELGIGGCERDLSKMARALDPTRFEVHVACFIPDGLRAPELRAAGVPILPLPVRSFASVSALQGMAELRRYLKRHRIQVVHCFDMPTVILGVPVARACRVPAVIACNLGHRDLFSTAYRRLLRVADKLAHCVVANSQATARHLEADEKVPAGKIAVSYNGVETRVFYAPEQRGSRVAPLRGAQLVIGAVCALRAEKRLDVLLEAFARVRMLLPGMKLAVVGSGPMLPALQSQAQRLGISADCHFEPAREDVAEWMRSMDIFVLASDSDSFPNALLEAMACGCAAAASNVGGVPELVRDGRNGLLFPAGDVAALERQLARLVEAPELRRSLAAEAQRTAQHEFSMEIAARRTESLYLKLLGQTAQAPAAAGSY